MIATVRLDESVSDKLERLCDRLHKKRSDVIREAIVFYAQSVEADRKSKIQKAVEKVMKADQQEYDAMEGTLGDGI